MPVFLPLFLAGLGVISAISYGVPVLIHLYDKYMEEKPTASTPQPN